jgi:hypothetical protein
MLGLVAGHHTITLSVVDTRHIAAPPSLSSLIVQITAGITHIRIDFGTQTRANSAFTRVRFTHEKAEGLNGFFTHQDSFPPIQVNAIGLERVPKALQTFATACTTFLDKNIAQTTPDVGTERNRRGAAWHPSRRF